MDPGLNLLTKRCAAGHHFGHSKVGLAEIHARTGRQDDGPCLLRRGKIGKWQAHGSGKTIKWDCIAGQPACFTPASFLRFGPEESEGA